MFTSNPTRSCESIINNPTSKPTTKKCFNSCFSITNNPMCWSQHVRIRGVVFRVTCWKHVRITFCGNILGLLCSMCNMLGLLEVHVCKLKMCVYTIHCFGSVKAKEDLLQSPGNTRLDFLFLRCRYHFNTKK